MKKIGIHGCYGRRNLGDEAILKAMLAEIKKHPKLKITVFSSEPKQVSKFHKVKSIDERGGKLDKLKRIIEIATENMFILGGGGLIKDYGKDSTSIKQWLELLTLAQKLNKKTALFAVGVQDIIYPDSKELVKKALNNTNIITVRDDYSKNLLKEIGIKKQAKVIGDPALLLTTNLQKTRKFHKNPNIVICVRHWFDKGFYLENKKANNQMINALSKAIDKLIKKYNAQITFIPLRTIEYDNDRIIAEKIASKIKNGESIKLINETPSIDRFIKILNNTTLLIGMRLHSLILASGLGIPVIGLEYSSKVKSYLECIGQQAYSLDLSTIHHDLIIDKTKKIFNNYNKISCSLVKECKKQRQIVRKEIHKLIKEL